MGIRAVMAMLVASIAFQFGMVIEIAQVDWFARLILLMSLTILTTSAVLLGITLERSGVA